MSGEEVSTVETTPYYIGQRVASLPHTDVWLAGNRYGRIVGMKPAQVQVRFDTGLTYWLPWDGIKAVLP